MFLPKYASSLFFSSLQIELDPGFQSLSLSGGYNTIESDVNEPNLTSPYLNEQCCKL